MEVHYNLSKKWIFRNDTHYFGRILFTNVNTRLYMYDWIIFLLIYPYIWPFTQNCINAVQRTRDIKISYP